LAQRAHFNLFAIAAARFRAGAIVIIIVVVVGSFATRTRLVVIFVIVSATRHGGLTWLKNDKRSRSDCLK
jgi:hypothetical protein